MIAHEEDRLIDRLEKIIDNRLAARPINFCPEHNVLAYKVDQVLDILRSWGTLIRRVLAGVIIAAIIAGLGFAIRTEINANTSHVEITK